MENVRYIFVILPLRLEWEPCYAIPQELMEEDIHIGDRVKVTFAGKEYTGTVSGVDVKPETDPTRIKPITSLERNIGQILPHEIELWRKVSEYYMCSIGEVYKAAYPYGKINLEEARAEAAAKAALRAVKRTNATIAAGEARIARLQERLEKKKLQIEGAKKAQTKERYIQEAERISEEIRITDAQIKSLKEGCTARITVSPEQDGGCNAKVILSEVQDIAYGQIKRSLANGIPAMLNGITGSGKTEIYIKLAEETLSQGKNVLYLVPEIALSRQLEERLRMHFGNSLMTFHSAETGAKRRDIAEAIRERYQSSNEERGYIVLGTRSSLFLPHHNLGLIIIDEEHDNSYKQDSPAPRYNGRDTALMLARIQGASVLMGSATPSLESLYNCQAGKYSLVSLNRRYHGSEDADIEIIDTKAERRKRGMRGNFSLKLIDSINRTLEAGEQIIILRSRRSYSPAFQCTECGELQKCPHCNVTLSWHKTVNRMVCHHCGWNTCYENKCSKCGGGLMPLGAGTQKIEEEAVALFPHARVSRLDSDTAQNKTFEARAIKDFSEGKTDILIGTQIISKGFDFSNLSLVVIIAADTLLGIQDFRADEKAVQLLEQLRGRCGRRGNKGKFIIQTSQPQHPVYQRISLNDSRKFSMDLLEERKEFGFPPYSRVISLSLRDIYEDRAIRMAMKLAKEIRMAIPDVTGPYSPMPDKIADNHIRCIRISLAKDRHLARYKSDLKRIIESFEKKEKYTGHIIIDVDPV